MHTIQILNHLVASNQLWAYCLIFLLVIIEGEVVAISTGILILLGALNFWICLVLIFCGGLIKTLLGYSLGVFLYKKFNHNQFFKYIEKKVFRVLPHFNQKPFRSIFFSKFIFGLNHLVLVFSGYQKVNFKTYLKAESLSTIIWTVLMLSLGYFFSYTALHVSHEIWKFSLIIILLIIAFFILDKLLAWLHELFEEFSNDITEEKI